jgi:hypothetical protein
VAQRVIGPEDFVADDDEVERRVFKLARRLSGVERQGAALEARVDIAIIHEYEQW